ncbi:MAG: hypothetical protein NTX66_03510 [Candidatus Falkowbacteria bacterium]|nr:hypothetical protein [Candidatus Falkowbacteria bacterium]
MLKKISFGLGLIFSLALLPSLVSAAPAAPTLISPANNAKNYNPSVTSLYWANVPGATNYDVQIQADNNNFSTFPDPPFTSVPPNFWVDQNYLLPTQLVDGNGSQYLTANQIYYWRVRAELGATTTTSNWSSSFKFTTASGPSAPSLLFPIKKTSGDNPIIYKDQPKDFSWKINGSGILFNKLIVYTTDAAGACTTTEALNLMVGGTKISSNILAKLDNGKYCWQIVSFNNLGQISSSKSDYFELRSSGLTPEQIFAQTGFNGVLFYWNRIDTAGQYMIKVSDKSKMENAATTTVDNLNYLFQSTSGNLYDKIKTNAGKTLYWQVGSANKWSKVKPFKSNFLKPFAITSPINNPSITATSSVLKWVAQPGVKFYKVEITPAAGGNPIKTDYTGGSTYKIPGGISWAPNTGYTWKVTAYNDFDKIESAASPAGSFTTKP